MPRIHVASFKVRSYECDAYGHVNNTNYLRYMQEAAFDASAAAGYPVEAYGAMGSAWYVRGTDIEYLRPVTYGDTVEVTTWVQDFRRATSRRAYELRSVRSGELAARAFTDWVFMDTAANRPARVPDEMIAAFGGDENAPEREPFPAQPSPSAGAYRMRRPVRFRDIDTAGHVNNAVYPDYFEECGIECVAHFGWSVSRMQQQGLGIIYRRAWIEYLQPARYGDELEVAAWLSAVKRATALRHFTCHRAGDGAPVARMTALGVAANLASGTPTRWPADMITDFAPNIA